MELVSVVLPVYEDLDHVERAVESVLCQAYDAVEIVVVHSGDPASFPDRVREQSAVTYVHQEPSGVAAARNRGLDEASGDVVGFCDADDYWHPDKLQRQLPLLQSGPDVVYADEYLVRDGRVHRIDSLPVRDPERHHVDFFRNGGGVGSRSVLARAACFEDERFDERFAVREDPHLWTRLFAQSTPARIAEPLSYKQLTPESLSSDVDRTYRMECLEIADLCERYPELRPYRAERERQTRYRYAKRLLSEDGRAPEARSLLRELRRDCPTDPRVWTLLALSALPAGNRWATRRLQDLFWTLRSYQHRLVEDGFRTTGPVHDGKQLPGPLSDGGTDDVGTEDDVSTADEVGNGDESAADAGGDETTTADAAAGDAATDGGSHDRTD